MYNRIRDGPAEGLPPEPCQWAGIPGRVVWDRRYGSRSKRYTLLVGIPEGVRPVITCRINGTPAARAPMESSALLRFIFTGSPAVLLSGPDLSKSSDIGFTVLVQSAILQLSK